MRRAINDPRPVPHDDHPSSPDSPGRDGTGARWTPVQAQTLSWRIVAQVRAALFSGELKSGDFLGSERSLARQFGVSRVAIRDALRTLTAIGLIEIRPGKLGGAWIAQGNPERFADALAIQLKLIGITEMEMLDAQAAIETHAAELAAKRATSDDLERMREILRRLGDLVDDPEGFTDRAMDFRASVVDASHSRALIAQHRALRHLLQPAYTLHTRRELTRRVVAAHETLLTRIASGDAEGARRTMARRLAAIRARTLAVMQHPAARPVDVRRAEESGRVRPGDPRRPARPTRQPGRRGGLEQSARTRK